MNKSAASQPLVTVVTATYNRADYLPETIESVLAQSHPNIEYIVLDDGSTDNTREVLARYGDRIRWESHPNMGESRTVNKGWSMAHGEFIITVSSDDPVLPGLIEKGVEFMQSHPDVIVAYPDWVMIDPHSKPLQEIKTREWSYLNLIRWHHCFAGPGSIMRRRCLELAGMRDPQYRYTADYEYWVRLGLHGPFARIPHTLATWRHHPGATTVAARGEAMAEEHVRLMKSFFARNDLPPEVRALRHEAIGVAYFVAGQTCFEQSFLKAKSHFRRCLWRFAIGIVMHPGGEPLCWRGILPRIVLPEPVYQAAVRCRRFLSMQRAALTAFAQRGRQAPWLRPARWLVRNARQGLRYLRNAARRFPSAPTSASRRP